MEKKFLFIIDLINFIFGVVLFISCIYSAWVNLIFGKISQFGFDAFILLILGEQRSKLIRSTSRNIQRMGFACLLIALGTVQPACTIYIENILPYFR